MPREHADSARQTGHDDRVAGRSFNDNPFLNEHNRAEWERGWRYADSRRTVVEAQQQIQREREELARAKWKALREPTKTAKEKVRRKRHEHGSDW